MISNKYLALFGLTMTLGIPAAQAVDFGAFGDVSYQGTTEKQTADGFVQGQFDLYTTQKIDPKTSVFVEMVFEADDTNAYGLDLERLNITRHLSPNFSLAWGRFHTPIGYWNTAYHHGALIQDTILRPTFLDFEDGSGAIFPTHIIGIMANGKARIGSGGDLEYMLALGNGSSVATNGCSSNPSSCTGSEIFVHNVVDTQDKKMVVGAINYTMSSTPLRIGVFALHDPFADQSTPVPTDLIGMTVWGADVRFASHGFDMIAEDYNISNKDKVGTAGSNDSQAFYVQLGYRFTEKFKTIYRYESVDFLNKDPYYHYLGTPEGNRHVVDLRYDLDDTNALKLEVARFESANTNIMKSYTFYGLQWAFMML